LCRIKEHRKAHLSDIRFEALIKFSRASSGVKWLKVDKTDVSKTISVPADEDGDGPRNVGVSWLYF
jgi:hypothetical protein